MLSWLWLCLVCICKVIFTVSLFHLLFFHLHLLFLCFTWARDKIWHRSPEVEGGQTSHPINQSSISTWSKWSTLQGLQELLWAPEADVEAYGGCLEDPTHPIIMGQSGHHLHPKGKGVPNLSLFRGIALLNVEGKKSSFQSWPASFWPITTLTLVVRRQASQVSLAAWNTLQWFGNKFREPGTISRTCMLSG